jgi:hypothetical protein
LFRFIIIDFSILEYTFDLKLFNDADCHS